MEKLNGKCCSICKNGEAQMFVLPFDIASVTHVVIYSLFHISTFLCSTAVKEKEEIPPHFQSS